EKLTGVETTIAQSFIDRITLRGTLFLMDVDGAIANRTLLFSPSQIVRQRENLGKIRSRGIEFEITTDLDPKTRAAVRYQYADSKIEESLVPAHEGLRTPQVPYHQASLDLQREWTNRFTSNIEARYASSQFEDDLNRFLLSDYFTLELTLRYNITQSLEIYAAAENLLNQQYELGRIPFPTYGPPRFVQLGVRFKN
ncbi:MAG TPA: TonB-dependent receptor, partial [Acidobacteriota bacterium]|nr:TonB-dependent receptor [Acidobacteriota bacterium]